jgi:DnaJ-class molecular chaperone
MPSAGRGTISVLVLDGMKPMRNPYEVLGVKPDAGEAEIRKAYRKLAKQYHPDLNPGNKAAEAKFKDVSAAYDLLSDAARRARFDRGEIDAEGHETFARAHAHAHAGTGDVRFSFGGGDEFSDLFSQMFGGRFGEARDLQAEVRVDFLDAVNGARRRVTVGGRSLDVAIPAGVTDGQTLRLKGQGASAAGDLLLEVRVAPHRLFRRQGDDIHADIPISLVEAVAGGRITVPTPSGQVALTVPPGSGSGKVLRLKGKGVAGRGDFYVTLKIALPDRVDDELVRFVRDWGPRHPYDPRAGL